MFAVPYQQLLGVAARVKNEINPKILTAKRNMWRRESYLGRAFPFLCSWMGKAVFVPVMLPSSLTPINFSWA